MTKNRAADIGILPLAGALLGSLGDSVRGLRLGSAPAATVTIPQDFLGVNVAPSDDPEVRDYTLARLDELGLRQIRMDFTYASPAGPAGEFLDCLLDRGFEVLLNVFPPREQAGQLGTDAAARSRWAAFLAGVFHRYQGRVAIFEIGNTPNRSRWSGFSSRSFIAAWREAVDQARPYDLRLAGPNISDFEPLYNGTYLRLISRAGAVPQVHTDNLFVERVIEPEAQDHRVLGRAATDLLKLNLVKKARILESIGRHAGCADFVCTYTCWTMKRLRRRTTWPERKAVDYLLRYLVLAASSGALRRVYWGPLICNRDGLIDDRATDYPEVDQVSHYEKVRGHIADFSVNPAFYALRHATARLAGARCRTLLHQGDGLSLFALEKEGEEPWLIAWCRDAMTWPLESIMAPAVLAEASFTDALGEALERPAVISEQPLFIRCGATIPTPDLAAVEDAAAPHIAHLSSPQYQSTRVAGKHWRGACMLRTDSQLADLELAARLEPARLPALAETRVLRDVRNRLWNVVDPRGLCDEVTVKLNRVKGSKRITYRFRPSKGRRHWNNACQMWRRGVATPLPVAFYEEAVKPGIRDSWYLCEFVPDAFSCRDVYAAFRDGASEYRGLDKRDWFDLLSGFVCNMHNKQVVHRDLSAGNLLLHQSPEGAIHPQVIDIGRAWIWSGPGSRVRTRHRLQDLIRICYKLEWPDRQLFLEYYEAHQGASLGRLWRVPFHYYDLKQRLKKGLKGKRKKRLPSA